LPWQRVVNKQGGLASGYWGGKRAHQAVLEAEGVKVNNFSVDIKNLIWWPDEK
jgi:alkylated DNA nucleotide flippase Atl1